jgi:hypothetical protein
MTERTHRKLDEARFFYRHLVEERKRDVINEPEAFGYYFSAFIQAARNVLWTLHNDEPEKWETWEPIWKNRLTEEQRKFLKFTNELRLDETKRGGTEKTMEWETVAIEELFPKMPTGDDHPAYIHARLRKSTASHWGVPMTAFSQRRIFYLQDGEGKQEAIQVCERYLLFLENAVREFVEAHAPTNPA